jgi:hypothetical protein
VKRISIVMAMRRAAARIIVSKTQNFFRCDIDNSICQLNSVQVSIRNKAIAIQYTTAPVILQIKTKYNKLTRYCYALKDVVVHPI